MNTTWHSWHNFENASVQSSTPLRRPPVKPKSILRRVSQFSESPPAGSPPPETVDAPPSTPIDIESPASESPSAGPRLSTIASNAPSGSLQSTLNEADSSTTLGKRRQSRKKGKKRSSISLLRFKPKAVLENSGSVARDHLASERTFLAYVRTSLAIASTGVALIQLFKLALNTDGPSLPSPVPIGRSLRQFAVPLGATMLVFGFVVLSVGTIRYFTIQKALTKGMFPIARFIMTGIAIALGIVIIIVFSLLVAERNSS
ncbi:hypothetical protein BDN71DRAFT_1387267 [Pleurotus eryngii]|uniref:DUF202 domain-containing protein n=1 Tax=Pleurotus eryngii TaxID=5323 RepID=A0A9P6DHN7_PLEER|nr:hypothetical protein BDN71DRAFT_1387267 [Pleurotus eryngii]